MIPMNVLNDIVWFSKKRRAIMLLLTRGPKSAECIMKELNMTAHSLSPELKILRDENLVIQTSDICELSPVGFIIAENMNSLFSALAVINKDRDYWSERDLSCIPPDLCARIGELGDYRILDSGQDYLFDLPAEFMENLKRSSSIRCFLSYYNPVYADVYFNEALSGKNVLFMFTESVFDRIRNEKKDALCDVMKKGSVSILVCPDDDDTRPASVCITDSFAYLSLFRSKNSKVVNEYETRWIISFDRSALVWNTELFDHYSKCAEKII